MKRILSLLAVLSALATTGRAQPVFLYEPQDISASPGAWVLFNALAIGPGPVTYQWFKEDTSLDGQTGDALLLSGLLAEDAGSYHVVATLFSGSVTSRVATLGIDAAFTKITSGEIITIQGNTAAAAWADYDNDGDEDVFMTRFGFEPNLLFRNEGNLTFTRITTGPPVTDLAQSQSASWADYDNDGFLDLFVANSAPNFQFGVLNFLYHNNGDGTFSNASSTLPSPPASSIGSAWADYDRDGNLDLFYAVQVTANGLLRNNGNSTFTQVLTGPIATDANKLSFTGAWSDYDDDGDSDLVVVNGQFGPNEALYNNNGDGTFNRVSNSVVTASGGNSQSCAWGDYDNDGDSDLVVANEAGQVCNLYRNDGGGQFTSLTSFKFTSEGADNLNLNWGDYDNDGYLDLFLARGDGQNNALFRNTRNGGFEEILTGSPVNDGATSFASSWVDIDNDGFQDLFVGNIGHDNFIYRNNGNSHAWIKIKLRGNASNRFGVGAKVRVLANLHGLPVWQLRETAARDGLGSPSTLLAEFGLGSAEVIDVLQIDWPSGVRQILEQISVRQTLTVQEPPSLGLRPGPQTPEGDAGLRTALFTLQFTEPAPNPVTIEFYTVDGTAIAGEDYVATNGSFTIPTGEITATVPVLIQGDLLDEPLETFNLIVTNVTGFPLANKLATASILDDDPLVLSVNNTSATESPATPVFLTFLLTLNKPVDYPVSVTFNTSGSAINGVDYIGTNGTATFPPGTTTVPLDLPVLDDLLDEADENVFLNLSSPVNVLLERTFAGGTIIDDDPVPTLSVDDITVVEGHSGTNQAIFTLSLSQLSGRSITLAYGTTNRTATATLDYNPRFGNLTLTAGTATRTFIVDIRGDTLLEPDESFTLHLYNLVNALPGKTVGTGTILDDDFHAQILRTPSGEIKLLFPTLSNRHYSVWFSPQLEPGASWNPLPGASSVLATGSVLEIIDPESAVIPQRFYQLLLLP